MATEGADSPESMVRSPESGEGAGGRGSGGRSGVGAAEMLDTD